MEIIASLPNLQYGISFVVPLLLSSFFSNWGLSGLLADSFEPYSSSRNNPIEGEEGDEAVFIWRRRWRMQWSPSRP